MLLLIKTSRKRKNVFLKHDKYRYLDDKASKGKLIKELKNWLGENFTYPHPDVYFLLSFRASSKEKADHRRMLLMLQEVHGFYSFVVTH